MIKLTKEELLTIDKTKLSGKVLCFVTDTVYGIGVMVDDNIKTGLDKIYQMKKRDSNKPLAVLAGNINQFIDHVILNKQTRNLFNDWPGALTIIFKKKDSFFDLVTNLDTIGIRIPNCNITLDILNHLGLIATTSVNLSSFEPINNLDEIINSFGEYIDYCVTDTFALSKTSSKVVDATTDEIKILRK